MREKKESGPTNGFLSFKHSSLAVSRWSLGSLNCLNVGQCFRRALSGVLKDFGWWWASNRPNGVIYTYYVILTFLVDLKYGLQRFCCTATVVWSINVAKIFAIFKAYFICAWLSTLKNTRCRAEECSGKRFTGDFQGHVRTRMQSIMKLLEA